MAVRLVGQGTLQWQRRLEAPGLEQYEAQKVRAPQWSVRDTCLKKELQIQLDRGQEGKQRQRGNDIFRACNRAVAVDMGLAPGSESCSNAVVNGQKATP